MSAAISLRLLHVEDWEGDAALVTRALKRGGYAVQSRRVTTAAEMQVALRDFQWEIVISDHSLPQFSAPQALAVLQQSGHDLPFIIVSGTMDEERVVAALRAGAHDFISKGNLARLVPAVERALREAAIRRQGRLDQARLREQEAGFRLLFESNPLPMWVYDIETLAFLEVNGAASAHYGYSRAEFLAMTIRDIRTAEEQARLDALRIDQLPRRERDNTWQHLTKAGRLIDVETISHDLIFGNRPARMVVVNDITEQRRAEAELRASEKRFRALIEHSADAITLVNTQGVVIYDSPNASRMLGYDPDELVGRSAFQRIHPEDVALGQEALRQALERDSAPVSGQLRLMHHDGRWRWVEYIATNLLAEPSVQAVVVNYRDITERKEAEVALQQSHLQLTTAYDATIEGWSRALDLRDKETEGHSQRVTELTLRLAQAAGLTDAELVHVRRGALLHDMGKLGIPDHILLKPEPLSDAEWDVMRQHPVFAYELLSPITFLRPALDIPYCHHERWDGSGYPRALCGEQIPLAARLFSVVDVWDALCSDRPYRAAWPRARVLEHIRSLAGSAFDPRAVEVFLRVMG